MSEPTPPELHVRNLGDLAELVPYLVGFEPRDSLVALVIDRGHVAVTARFDLADAGQPGGIQNILGRLLARYPQTPGVYLMAYTDNAQTGWDLLQRGQQHLGSKWANSMLINGATWYAPGGATGAVNRSGPLAAEATFHGLQRRDSRRAVEADLASPPATPAMLAQLRICPSSKSAPPDPASILTRRMPNATDTQTLPLPSFRMPIPPTPTGPVPPPPPPPWALRERVPDPQPDPEPDPAAKKSFLDLSLTGMTGGALAAVSAAALGARLGVAGTLLGAAVGSLLSAFGAALYTHSLRRTRDFVRTYGRLADRPQASYAESYAARRPESAVRRLVRATQRLDLRRVALGAAALFALVIALVTGLELATGSSLDGKIGTTVGQVGKAATGKSGKAPVTTPLPQVPTESSTPSGATSSDPATSPASAGSSTGTSSDATSGTSTGASTTDPASPSTTDPSQPTQPTATSTTEPAASPTTDPGTSLTTDPSLGAATPTATP